MTHNQQYQDQEHIVGDSAPIEQRNFPTLQEALQSNPADGPRPLTIAEFRARKARKEKKKTKRGGQVRKLLQRNRLQKELLETTREPEYRQRYIERINELKIELRQRAKKRKGAAEMRKP